MGISFNLPTVMLVCQNKHVLSSRGGLGLVVPILQGQVVTVVQPSGTIAILTDTPEKRCHRRRQKTGEDRRRNKSQNQSG